MKATRTLSLLTAVAALSWMTLGVATAQEAPPVPAPAPVAEAPAVPAAPPAETPKPPEPAPAAAVAAPAAEAPVAAAAEAKVSLEQRVGILEAYLTNGDPSAPLKTGKNEKGDPDFPKDFDQAKDAPTSVNSGPGHNGFMMICAALVLFMTLPGLALFYGGLVRKKNVLSVCAQCLGCAGLVTILWWAFGYSLVFGKSFNSPFIGGSEFFFLKGVTAAPNTDYSYWVSHNVFSMYQLMFAIITPALIIGAIAERMKYLAIMLFIGIWMFVVYFPMAHMVWGITGFMNGVWNAGASIKAIDFAGGTVVHMTSGWSALILCLILGKRLGFGKENMAPHSMVLCMVGTGMLWVGWYGFNAGSAVAADGVAANAFMTTTLAAATAGFVWALAEWIQKGHPSILGFCSGIVAGLVVITPACGFVNATGGMIIGVLAGLVPYVFVVFLKGVFGYDDALDTFGVHAVGGTLGAILTGLLATVDVNANLSTNLKDIVGKTLVFEQLKAVAFTLTLSIIGTIIIAIVVKVIVGLRPTPEVESAGLDISEHGEEGYII
ncbi:MAG: ammonium transporter, Amt family [Chthoniobacter sp.]|jgi:Amt family ammonium transporter|nr:ammonium transporter, Amt family [Chthoniobacter sp.]